MAEVSIYLSKLTPHGVIIAQISNRHIDLTPEVANVAFAKQLTAYFAQDNLASDPAKTLKMNARIVMLARAPEDAGRVAQEWIRLQPDRSRAVWTDNYSNVLGEMLRTKLGL